MHITTVQINNTWLNTNWLQLCKCGNDLEWDTWQYENYNCELPKKFELSYAYFLNKEIIGFHIVSEQNGTAHLHRYMINKQFRQLGYASIIWKKMLNILKARNYSRLTWKVAKTNHNAIEFYNKKQAKTLSHNNGYLFQYININ